MPEVVFADVPFSPPAFFDGFKVERPLGRGGMGHVYLGRDVELDRLVALKFVATSDASLSARERFRREARAIARLSHPNVVSIYRIGEVPDGQPYIAYEFVSGTSLERAAIPLPWPLVLVTAVGIARGLEAVHRAGILHRDVKPANVVVSDAGQVKVIDFGLASLTSASGDGSDDEPRAPSRHASPSAPTLDNLLLTRPGAILGTPAYIAPEIWCGEGASTRSDVYALGMTLFELLVGRLPHAGLGFEEIPKFLLLRDLPPVRMGRPDMPESFAAIVDRCLRRDPRERFASGAEVREMLETTERIFVQAGGGIEKLSFDTHRIAVASSFVRVKMKAGEFARDIYDRLFARSPELRSLFPTDMSAQEKKLVHMLEVAIDALSAPESLDALLADLGRRHVHYGAKAEHFQSLWSTLLETLAKHEGEAWTTDLEAAWKHTLELLEARMRRGMEREKPTQLSAVRGAGNVLRVPPPIFGSRPSTIGADSWQPPRTQYAREGDVELAYQVFGVGAVDIVVLMGWMSHVELDWAHPAPMGFLDQLGRAARVVTYDKRGTGLSNRTRETACLDDHVQDLVRVCSEARLRRPVLFGIGDGAATALVASALHPERFSGVIAYGASAEPRTDAFVASVEKEIANRWGEPILLDALAPSLEEEAAFRDWLALYMRMAASPTSAQRMFRAWAESDLRSLLPHAGLPALVLHRAGDRFVPVAHGERLAGGMPNARFVSLEGSDHLPFASGSDAIVRLAREFASQVARVDASEEIQSPLRFVAAYHEAAPAAAELAAALGGTFLGTEDNTTAWSFTSAVSASLFLESVAKSHAKSGEAPLRCALEAVPIAREPIRALAQRLATRGPAVGPIAAALLRGAPARRPSAGGSPAPLPTSAPPASE